MYRLTKRILDIILAVLAFFLTAWFLLPCMLILWLTGENRVWYLQERIGYRNKSFGIIKFATMLKNSPNMGTGSITLRKDPRVLPFGKFMRRTKINELPQIFNVLNGTMSIVGPRPQMEVDFYRFPKQVQDHIYDAKPGITGIGSVVFRDEERLISALGVDPIQVYCEHIAPYKGELELWYLKHASMWVDIKLIVLTAWCLFFPKTSAYYKWFKDLPEQPEFFKTC